MADLDTQIAELCELAATLSLRPLPFVNMKYVARHGWQVQVEVRPPRRKDRWVTSMWCRTLPAAIRDARTQVDQLIAEKKAR